jgi:hypothetical protein
MTKWPPMYVSPWRYVDPLTFSVIPFGVNAPMPTEPSFSTASRHALFDQNPIFEPNPPTNRSADTQSPPSLLFDLIRPLTSRSTFVPPPPTTSRRAPGVPVPIPTFPSPRTQNLLASAGPPPTSRMFRK